MAFGARLRKNLPRFFRIAKNTAEPKQKDLRIFRLEDQQSLAGRGALALGTLRKHPRHVRIDRDLYTKTFLVQEWPLVMDPETLRRVVGSVIPRGREVAVRVTVRYAPPNPPLRWNWQMSAKLRRLEGSIQEAETQRGAMPRPEEVKALRSLQYLRDSTAFEDADVMDVWCFITIYAKSEYLLEKTAARLQRELKNKQFHVHKLTYEQTCAFMQTHIGSLPDTRFYRDYHGRIVDQKAAASVDCLVDGSLSDGTGIYIGHRLQGSDNSAVYLDMERDSEQGKNFLILGSTGKGKSTFIKALVTSLLEEGYRIYVFDVDGEYRYMCQKYGGLWIDHTLASGRYMDPLRLQEPIGKPEFDNARWEMANATLRRTVSLLCNGLSPAESNAVDRALMATWAEVGVDPDRPETWDKNKGATIHLWYQKLADESSEAAQSVREKLWQYFEGSMRNLFSQQDELKEPDVPLVVFHVGQSINNETEALVGAVKMSLAMDYVWRHIQRDRAIGTYWSAVVFDEGQRALTDPEFSAYINTVCTTIRKFNGLAVLATNKPAVLWAHSKEGTRGGTGFWSNSAFKVLFNLEQSDAASVRENGAVPDVVISQITALHARQFLLQYGQYGYDKLQLHLPDEELALYRTRGLRGTLHET